MQKQIPRSGQAREDDSDMISLRSYVVPESTMSYCLPGVRIPEITRSLKKGSDSCMHTSLIKNETIPVLSASNTATDPLWQHSRTGAEPNCPTTMHFRIFRRAFACKICILLRKITPKSIKNAFAGGCYAVLTQQIFSSPKAFLAGHIGNMSKGKDEGIGQICTSKPTWFDSRSAKLQRLLTNTVTSQG